MVSTPLGPIALAICGDVFNEAVVARLVAAGPDLVLVPLARGFDDDAPDVTAWATTALDDYRHAAREIGTTALFANYIGPGGTEDCVGGAFAIGADGTAIAVLPVLEPGLLFVDL